MKKILLLIALIGFLNQSVNSQILFKDDFTGQTTTGQTFFGPPNTSLYETLESDGRSTLDSAIHTNKSWMFINYSDIGPGYFSSSFWANNSSSLAANDFLILKNPINLAGKVAPYLTFDYYASGDSSVIEVKIATSISGTAPAISDFNSAPTVWTSTYTNSTKNMFITSGIIDLSAYSGNVYIAVVNRTSVRRSVGVRFIQLKSRISQDLLIKNTTLDTSEIAFEGETNTLVRRLTRYACNDTVKDINISIQNVGTNPITSFTTNVSFDDINLKDTLNSIFIAPGSTYSYKFSKKISYNVNRLYKVRVAVNVIGDTLNSDDTTRGNWVITQGGYKLTTTTPFKTGFELYENQTANLKDEFTNFQSRFYRAASTTETTRTLLAPNDFTGNPSVSTFVNGGTASLASFITAASAQTQTGITTNMWYNTPCIDFETSKRYYISFWTNPLGSAPLSIRYGSSQAESAMTGAIASGSIFDTVGWVKSTFTIPAACTGLNHIGLNFTGRWYVFFDDFEIGVLTPPVANFTVTTDVAGNIDYDSIVSVSNTSTGEGITYSWNFGDPSLGAQNTSTLQNPTPRKYTKPGKYTITLTVTNGAGTNTKTIEIEVKELPAPVANFTTTINGLKVRFVNTSTPDISSPASIATTYSWDFGDASALSTVKSPTEKTYSRGGKYNICLTAKNKVGEDTKCSEVNLAGVGIASVDFDQVQIFPNPVRDGKVYVQNDMNTVLLYKVTDMLGKLVSSDKLLSNKEGQIDLSNVPNGIYFIELDSKGERIIKKIVVDKQ